MGRSIVAVVAGFITMIALDGIGGSIIKSALPGQPPTPEPVPASALLFSILVVNTLISSVGAGYVCALIARVAPLAHAGALVVVVLCIRGAMLLTHRDLPAAVLLQDVGYAGASAIAVLLGARIPSLIKAHGNAER
jgi:hypothetical protein